MELRPIILLGAAMSVLALLPLAASAQGQRGRRAAGCPVESRPFHQCALEKAKTFNPPRTPEGTPDFRGYWNVEHNGAVWDLEPRPGQGPIAPASTGLRVDGTDSTIPYQPWALAKRNALAP